MGGARRQKSRYFVPVTIVGKYLDDPPNSFRIFLEPYHGRSTIKKLYVIDSSSNLL